MSKKTHTEITFRNDAPPAAVYLTEETRPEAYATLRGRLEARMLQIVEARFSAMLDVLAS